MTRTAKISSRIDPELKEQGDAVLAAVGLSASDAITMFYRQIVLQRGLPFSAVIPNDETIAAMREARDPEFRANAKRFNSVEDLMADLNA